MALIQSEIDVCNQALDRIAAGNIELLKQADVKGLACNLHFVPTRDALLRSYEWNFACARAELAMIYNLTLDTAPGPDLWVVGDIITGITSGATATILTVISGVEYEIAYLVGTFTDGETVTNGDVEPLEYRGNPVFLGLEPVVWYEDTDQLVCGTGYPVVVEEVPVFGYDHQYVLPTDFMRLRLKGDYYHYKFEIEGNRILTDHDQKHITYVKKVTDPTLWDALFTELFVLKLALKLANALAGTGSGALKAEIKQEIQYAEAKARIVSAAEDNSSGEESFTRARYGA
jgi:hypothetical protein